MMVLKIHYNHLKNIIMINKPTNFTANSEVSRYTQTAVASDHVRADTAILTWL